MNLSPDQKRRCREALAEMNREGIKLSKRKLRERAGVCSNAAAECLRLYRAGEFPIEDPRAKPQARAPLPPPEGALVIPAQVLERAAELGGGMGGLDFNPDHPGCHEDLAHGLALASILGDLLNSRRRAAVLAFARVMAGADEAELGEVETLDEEDAAYARLGLDPDTRAPIDPEDAGLAALTRLGVDSLGAWDRACRGEADPQTTQAHEKPCQSAILD